MATPVVPNQFAVGKNQIVHKPTRATFRLDTGHTNFKSVNRKEPASNDHLVRITEKTISCGSHGSC